MTAVFRDEGRGQLQPLALKTTAGDFVSTHEDPATLPVGVRTRTTYRSKTRDRVGASDPMSSL
jgi:hypothetical protein